MFKKNLGLPTKITVAFILFLYNIISTSFCNIQNKKKSTNYLDKKEKLSQILFALFAFFLFSSYRQPSICLQHSVS